MVVWLIIGVAMVLIIGPMFWAMPSRRDRAVSGLRAAARELDLSVEMRRIPHPDPEPEDRVSASGVDREPKLQVAAYKRPLRLPSAVEPRHIPSWRVLYAEGRRGREQEGRGDEDAMLPRGWRFERAGLPLTEGNLDRLGGLLQRMPAGTVAVECDGQACAVCWRERGDSDTVLRIRDLLGELAGFQEALALEAMAEADAD